MTEKLTEERLAEIERWADESRLQGLSLPDALLLLAEVRRLRNERNEARGLAREYRHALEQMSPYDVSALQLEKDLQSHPWLLEPEHATATGVAKSVFRQAEPLPPEYGPDGRVKLR